MHPVLTVVEWQGVARPVGSYGAMLVLALLCGSALTLRAAQRRGLDVGSVISALAGAVAAGCVGAYACSVAVSWGRLGSLHAALEQPGIVFYGGLISGGLALAGCARMFGLPPSAALDCALPGLPIAHALGRLGCWLGGCCYGARSDLPWAVAYPESRVTRHPWPLYEAALLLLLAAAFWPQQRFAARPGRRAALYLASYAFARFWLEPLRGDPERGLFWNGSLSFSQLLSVLLLTAALAFLARGSLRPRAGALAAVGVLLALPAAADAPQLRELPLQVAARVRISGGWFEMGCKDGDAAERPPHRVFLHAYAIDRTEVSNAAHQRCVRAGQCYPARGPAGAPEQPVTQLTWGEARAYCRFTGGDLATEAQWEYAARGSSGRSFPWGNVFNASIVTAAPATAPSSVDANHDGRSFFGLLNMAGNVAELVRDRFAPNYQGAQRRVDPEGPPTGNQRVVRGGSFRSAPQALRATAREAIAEDEARADVGLRCAYPQPP